MKHRLAALALVALVSFCALAGSPPYAFVDGLNKFDGSSSARDVLQTNGFVVADPGFPHFFQLYIESPLPVLITPDSAWHIYHQLLGRCLSQAETAQRPRLAAFSRRLMTVAEKQAQIDGLDFAALSAYAAIGLALQDDDFAESLPDKEKKIVDALRSGSGAVETGVGFPLDARAFKPPSFAAQQWYATVDFRLSDPRETRLALCLVWLIQQDPELNEAWQNLNALRDEAYGPSPDTAAFFNATKNIDPSAMTDRLDSLRQSLEKSVSAPSLNDQLLPPDEAEQFAQAIKGFRLFPPIRVPEWPAVGALPNSIVGHSLQVLTNLQQPLPDSMPQPFHSPAWADLQRWSALGAWADLRQEINADAKVSVAPQDNSERPKGVVAPYPKFFSDLAENCRQAAATLQKQGADDQSLHQLTHFGLACDRLAVLAQKQLDGVDLNPEDERWIRNYGRLLQNVELDSGDDAVGEFPIVSRLDPDPTKKSVPFAWLAEPQALYVILPWHHRLQLFCGAIFSYRSASRLVSNEASTNEAPPAPEFTQIFRAEKTIADLLADLSNENSGADGFGDQGTTAQELEARISDADLPLLIQALADGDPPIASGVSPLTSLIAKLNWQPYQKQLLELAANDEALVPQVLTIVGEDTDSLDADWICANYDRQPPRARALDCWLLGKHKLDAGTSALLDRATHDTNEEVRWTSAMALRELHLTGAPEIAALEQRLSDTNEYIAAAAARALGASGDPSVAALLLTNLSIRLAQPSPIASLDLLRQSQVLQGFGWGERVGFIRHRRGINIRNAAVSSPADEAMIEALGELRYQPATNVLFGALDGEFGPAAATALDQLDPAKLRHDLLASSLDAAKSIEDRDRALQLLAEVASSKELALQLAPLLEVTNIVQSLPPGMPAAPALRWRFCDRAAEVINHLLNKPSGPPRFLPPEPDDTEVANARKALLDAGAK